jgi:hypothetical protein
MFQTKAVEKIKTQLLFKTFYFSKIVLVMRQREKNLVDLDRPQMKI